MPPTPMVEDQVEPGEGAPPPAERSFTSVKLFVKSVAAALKSTKEADADEVTTDLRILAEDGLPVLELRGVRARRFAIDDTGEWFHEIEWIESQPADAVDRPNVRHERMKGASWQRKP